MFECKCCGKSFDNPYDLEEHTCEELLQEKIEHLEKKVVWCEKRWRDEEHKLDHLVNHVREYVRGPCKYRECGGSCGCVHYDKCKHTCSQPCSNCGFWKDGKKESKEQISLNFWKV